MTRPKPRKHFRPTAEQMDERVKAPLSPDQLIAGLLAAGPDPDDVETPDKPDEAPDQP